MTQPNATRTRARARGGLLMWVALGLGALGNGCDKAAQHRPPPADANIVLIVIDTLRADHLGCYGYFRETSPNIDAFANQATFFEQAYAPMATTVPSHTSLFTGLYPLEHGILANVGDGGHPFRPRPGLRSVAQLARDNGYATAAFVSGAPLKRVCGLDAGFDLYDQPRGATRPAKRVTAAAVAWLDRHAGRPFFLFVHYFDPHVPYRPPPRYRARFRNDAALERYLSKRRVPEVVRPGRCKGRAATVTRRAINLYDAEIRYCDEHVGHLLDALRDHGLWDKSVIILAADHGEGLNQHDWPQHGRTWNEQVHVPLMIRFPPSLGLRPRRFSPLVSLIDVFPTVLGQLEVPWAEKFLKQARGVDVLTPDFQARAVLSQRSGRDCGQAAGPLYALTTPRWRYHWYEDGRELLFDPLADPYELHDLSTTVPELPDLRRQTHVLVAQLKQRGPGLIGRQTSPVKLDPQLLREMQALGYTGDWESTEVNQPSSAPTTSHPAANPASYPANHPRGPATRP